MVGLKRLTTSRLMTTRTSNRSIWVGRSGQMYSFCTIADAQETMRDDQFYAYNDHGRISWAGSKQDVILDQSSREKFRTAIANGAELLVLPAAETDIAHMTRIWDLEGTDQHCVEGKAAA